MRAVRLVVEVNPLQDAVESLQDALKKCAAASVGPEYISQKVAESLGRSRERLHLVWARIEGDAYPPQFIAAFTDGEVEAMPELHEDRLERAVAEFKGLTDLEVVSTLTTFTYALRPEPALQQGEES